MSGQSGNRVEEPFPCFGPVADFSRAGTYVEFDTFECILGDTVMASNARIFFAGAGTTFVILGAGFGGGLFMANSALSITVALSEDF